jgi:peptidoglycan hydrolase-like protein with peptidoglycan-binding domain
LRVNARAGRALILAFMIILAVLILQGTAMAAEKYKAKTTCKLYNSTSQKAKVRKVAKGRAVNVHAVKGKWCKVSISGVKGYMLKSTLTKAVSVKPKSASGYSTLRSGSSGSAVKRLQTQLAKRGYLSSGAVNGRYSSSTVKAVRKFQMLSGISVSGAATSSTQKKLFSSNSRRPKVSMTRWSNYSMSKIFPKGSLATIVDLNTGARMRIRRVGGSNHFDVEPAYASDTAILKRLYGGTWSWNSRAVVLIARGQYIAGAINGMPHGAQISKSNNFEGQFCLHLYGSTTHGSGDSNSAHQRNVRRAYNYFK